jgi:MinD superfamily P-loop ATPase
MILKNTAEAIKQARSGTCPHCGGESGSCDPRIVHPGHSSEEEAYACQSCGWCVVVFEEKLGCAYEERLVVKGFEL